MTCVFCACDTTVPDRATIESLVVTLMSAPLVLLSVANLVLRSAVIAVSSTAEAVLCVVCLALDPSSEVADGAASWLLTLRTPETFEASVSAASLAVELDAEPVSVTTPLLVVTLMSLCLSRSSVANLVFTLGVIAASLIAAPTVALLSVESGAAAPASVLAPMMAEIAIIISGLYAFFEISINSSVIARIHPPGAGDRAFPRGQACVVAISAAVGAGPRKRNRNGARRRPPNPARHATPRGRAAARRCSR